MGRRHTATRSLHQTREIKPQSLHSPREFMLAVAMSGCRCGFSAGMNPIIERSVKRVSNEGP